MEQTIQMQTLTLAAHQHKFQKKNLLCLSHTNRTIKISCYKATRSTFQQKKIKHILHCDQSYRKSIQLANTTNSTDPNVDPCGPPTRIFICARPLVRFTMSSSLSILATITTTDSLLLSWNT